MRNLLLIALLGLVALVVGQNVEGVGSLEIDLLPPHSDEEVLVTRQTNVDGDDNNDSFTTKELIVDNPEEEDFYALTHEVPTADKSGNKHRKRGKRKVLATREINAKNDDDVESFTPKELILDDSEGEDFNIWNDEERSKTHKGNKVSKERAQQIMEALGWKPGNGNVRKRLNKN